VVVPKLQANMCCVKKNLRILMKNFTCINKYLTGECFSTSKTFKYGVGCQQDRVSLLTRLCRDQSVIHIGCCDHAPILPEKFESGRWLHSRLTDVSSRCLGVDIDITAVEVAKNLTSYDNIICHDITSKAVSTSIREQHWDVAVFGEILEHIPNPVLFLEMFIENYGDVIDKIIFTVPNAHSISKTLSIFRSSESINTDHRFEFTPYTIMKVLKDSKLDTESLYLSFNPSSSLSKLFFKKMFLRFFPLMSDSIIVSTRINES